MNRNRGLTMVEITIVFLLVTMIFGFIYTLFSHGVRSTIKGTDTLESIRAASLLFSQMRKDLSACQRVDSGGAQVTLAVSDTDLPPTATFSAILAFSTRNATTTYRLETSPNGKKYISRTFEAFSMAPERRTYGVPRMKAFEVVQITKRNKIGAATWNPNQILVNVVIDSDDPRVPTKEVRLNTLFVTTHLEKSNWNFIYF
jgi:type II secretory pathway pseudopilin PulG